MLEEIEEGKVKIYAELGKVTKKLEVFYNPVMKYNRDTSIELLNKLKVKNLRMALPLAGSGIRGLRFLKELKKGKLGELHLNDNRVDFKQLILQVFALNKIKNKIHIYNQDANEFLLQSVGFDYIDVDPFGTPNPFLDSAVKRISREGILAVTATDTAPLAGTYPKACKRKYWAMPLRNHEMHEIGLRILIRKVQLIGAQFDKALTPVLSFYKDHYLRSRITKVTS